MTLVQVRRLLHQHLGDALAFLAGLLGDQRVLEHDLGDAADVLAVLEVFDAAEVGAAVLEAALAAAAGVDLGLEDHRGAAEAVERLLRLRGRGGDDAPGHRRPGLRQ